MDNELLLFDRIEKIKQVINQYGVDNFYLSFSGGKDSTILHYLIDMALPNNNIPRVFSNTGIEYNLIVDFVKNLAEFDKRFVIIQPKINIKKMLEEKGYPFKSKDHSTKVYLFQNGSNCKSINSYISRGNFGCPKCLKYQFNNDFKLKISPQCCNELKKKPFKSYQKESGKTIAMTGMRKEEGGQRTTLNCAVVEDDRLIKFHPLAVVSDDWEEWLIKKYSIKLCKLYYPPYSFIRTGCKGCPYSINLQKQLDVMDKYFPNEKKQCEMIWQPVYEEYRRIGYRLQPYKQINIFSL